jgi:hypothetical protein
LPSGDLEAAALRSDCSRFDDAWPELGKTSSPAAPIGNVRGRGFFVLTRNPKHRIETHATTTAHALSRLQKHLKNALANACGERPLLDAFISSNYLIYLIFFIFFVDDGFGTCHN